MAPRILFAAPEAQWPLWRPHLIAAFGLMTFGSGPIRGFAITLTIGILTSMFTSVTGTHSLVALVFGRSSKLKSLPV